MRSGSAPPRQRTAVGFCGGGAYLCPMLAAFRWMVEEDDSGLY